MKRLMIMAAFLICAGPAAFPQSVNVLWEQVAKAEKAGKPQTAAASLRQLEQKAVDNGDLLERYYISDKLYNALRKYNWKEANAYQPTFATARKSVMDDLDSSISRYASHPRISVLLYEKMSRHRNELFCKGDNATGDEFRALRKECEDILSHNPDKECRDKVESEILFLDQKELQALWNSSQSIPGKEDSLLLSAKNIDEATISLFRLDEGVQFVYGGEKRALASLRKMAHLISSRTIKDFRNEYAIPENVSTAVHIPQSGNYVIHVASGDKETFCNIFASDIAGASRVRNGRLEIYAADLTTGRPLESVTASFFPQDGKKVSECIMSRNAFFSSEYRLDGFTPTGADEKLKGRESVYVRLESDTDKGAPLMDVASWQYDSQSTHKSQARNRSYLMTDRKLYRQTDTIRFKVICFSCDATSGNVRRNEAVRVTLSNSSDGKTVAESSLTTNDMGSASGWFTLPQGAKNGTYTLSAEGGAYARVRVETYKRPEFSTEFEKAGGAFCFSDVISQKGEVYSYAGYPVAGAKVEYEVVRRYFPRNCRSIYFERDTLYRGSTMTDGKGAFTITFKADRPKVENTGDCLSAAFEIKVKVTDPKGGTMEDSVSIPVSDIPLDLNVNVPSWGYHEGLRTIDKKSADSLTIQVTTLNGTPYDISGTYELYYEEKLYRKDSFRSNSAIFCPFMDMPSGKYTILAKSMHRGREIKSKTEILSVGTDDRKVPVKSQCFFYPVRSEGVIDFLVGTSEEDLYLDMEILDGHNVLYHEALHLSDEMRHINMPYLPQYGTEVSLELLGFRNGELIRHTHRFTNPVTTRTDLKFTFLKDRTAPGIVERLELAAAPGSEVAISIFDITTDRFGKNDYSFIPLSPVKFQPVPTLITSVYGSPYATIALHSRNMESKAVMAEVAVNDGMDLMDESTDLRSDFGESLGFFPHVRTGKDGKASIDFATNDLLGTFRILALSHTSDLKTGNADTTFIVRKPVMISPNLPLFAREGDRIVIKAGLINLTDRELDGVASIRITDGNGRDILPEGSARKTIRLPSNSQDVVSWSLKVPETKKLTVKIQYSDGSISDGEINTVNVEPASIELTEAASFIMGGDKGFRHYEKQMRSEYGKFHPVITRAEYSTMDAVRESLPQASEPESGNAIEWTDQLYLNQMRASVLGSGEDAAFRSKAFARISELQNSDGGIKWFDGMSSSQAVTLHFLEKIGQLREAEAISLNEMETETVRKALRFIDADIAYRYSLKNPSDFGNIQEMAVRSMWLDMPLSADAHKGMKQFLTGTSDGWQDISILQKALLCRTLIRCRNTAFEEKGMNGRIAALAASLQDHAVENSSAGCYFPNAVMPFRGLMNNEIYAHAQLMELFHELGKKKTVNGIAQWLLLQKHNQAWENTTATCDAVHALVGSKAGDLKFGAVYCTYSTSIDEVTPAANEIEIKRTFIRASDGKILSDGDILATGDQITVRYEIHNSENRSFVQMRAMRPASFYPKDERSRYSWGGYYREVRESETRYWWELLPEENTIVEERFFVTQEGTFSSALAQIECLYAKEYRGHTGPMKLQSR